MDGRKVKVAVRVRPLNEREEELSSENVTQVNGNQVILLPPSSHKEKDRKEPHIFTFDNCFWTEDKHNLGQDEVFRHLGDGVLDNIWQGYNSCVFAYGQTGSGKTFSMMGTDEQPGIIPRICSALFERVSSDSNTIKTEVSYFEIYNEEVRDLLLRSTRRQKKLRIREDKVLGPYVEELSCHAVQSYNEIKLLLDQGNNQRVVAETKMNEQSSRSHAILTLTVTQTCINKKFGSSRELVSKVSLVDLAGSERSYKSGAQGDQLRECSNINKSLTTLGLVINSLAEISEKKRKSTFVNYRDSALTWLLKNNLGGNSKTIMLATVSPAADNYQETLSTLRYADSAKRIVNQAVVNEDVKSKAIEELQGEIRRLREELNEAEHEKVAQVEELKVQLEEKENLLTELQISWEEKLKRTEAATLERQKNLEKMGITVNKQDVKFDKQCYLIQQGRSLVIHDLNDMTRIGSDPSQDIEIAGDEIESEHCVISSREEGEVFLSPAQNSRTYVNGCLCKTETQLWHEDKILLGTNSFFMLHLPTRQRPEHGKRSVTSEAQTQDELNKETDMSSRCSTNNTITDEEMNTVASTNQKINNRFTQRTLGTDIAITKDKQKSKTFTQISTQSNDQPLHVKSATENTERSHQGKGAAMYKQDSTVQCSPWYHEASSQTLNVSDPSATPQSDEGRRKHIEKFPGIFHWDTDIDIQWLTELLLKISVSAASVCCISYPPGCYWKSVVHMSSPVILLYSATSQTHWSHLEEFLTYCTSTCGKHVVVIIVGLTCSESERKVREDWGKWRFPHCQLITLTQPEMDFLTSDIENTLDRRMATKLNAMKEILEMAAERTPERTFSTRLFQIRKVDVGLFSVSDDSDYSWLVTLLKSEYFSEQIWRVTPCYISNSGFQQFRDAVSQCSFGILYHTKNRGRVNVTDVVDSLYDEELKYLRTRLGKDNVIVVIDDLQDSSDQEKERILQNQPSIGKLARDLFLFTQEEKKSEIKPYQMSESLLKMNRLNLERKMQNLEFLIKRY
ncbi:kinesin-like protein KIF13A [Hyperolius riggenbachi]|uniref:kinesin-like protein KIF13A n=1 Tax=Hyperolius riggenbachi TaxID=752182 RepID=UPI0035A2C914